jgi:hypothetical protein
MLILLKFEWQMQCRSKKEHQFKLNIRVCFDASYFKGWFPNIKVRKKCSCEYVLWWPSLKKVRTVLISTSMVTPFVLPNFNGLCVRKQTKELLITYFVFTVLREVLERVSMFADIQLSSPWKRNSQAFRDSGHILYVTCKFDATLPV